MRAAVADGERGGGEPLAHRSLVADVYVAAPGRPDSQGMDLTYNNRTIDGCLRDNGSVLARQAPSEGRRAVVVQINQIGHAHLPQRLGSLK